MLTSAAFDSAGPHCPNCRDWLNGYRLVEYDLDSDDFRTRVAASKFREQPEFARVHRGRLGLQDHGDVIRFRSIRLCKL